MCTICVTLSNKHSRLRIALNMAIQNWAMCSQCKSTNHHRRMLNTKEKVGPCAIHLPAHQPGNTKIETLYGLYTNVLQMKLVHNFLVNCYAGRVAWTCTCFSGDTSFRSSISNTVAQPKIRNELVAFSLIGIKTSNSNGFEKFKVSTYVPLGQYAMRAPAHVSHLLAKCKSCLNTLFTFCNQKIIGEVALTNPCNHPCTAEQVPKT